MKRPAEDGDMNEPMYYRSPVVSSRRSLPRDPRLNAVRFKKKATGADNPWYVMNNLLGCVPMLPLPIFACEREQKGTGVLYTNVEISKKGHKKCSTELITEGTMQHLDEDGYCYVLSGTYFDLPCTLYDPEYKSNKLPGEAGGEAVDYYVRLSPNQIPPDRYSEDCVDFFRENMIEVEPPGGGEGSLPLGRGFIISPRRSEAAPANGMIAELYKSRVTMMVSNIASQRISTSDENVNKEVLAKAGKSPSPAAPGLLPKPVKDCDICGRFAILTDRSLEEFCGYSYTDDQYEAFQDGTNYLVNGVVSGSIMGSLFVKGHPVLERAMFMGAPTVHCNYITYATCMSFVCLYPPDDAESWRRYAVCTSDASYFFDYRDETFNISLQKDFFGCRESPGGRTHNPYCVFQLPYMVSCGPLVTSYVRYLPTKEGGWVDVKENPEARPYSKLMLFVSMQVGFQELAIRDEYLEDVVVMTGNPRANCTALEEYNWINMNTYFARLKDDNTLGDYFVAMLGGTTVFNDFCYLFGYTSSPTDFKKECCDENDPEESFKVKPRKRGKARESPGAARLLRRVQYNEAISIA